MHGNLINWKLIEKLTFRFSVFYSFFSLIFENFSLYILYVFQFHSRNIIIRNLPRVKKLVFLCNAIEKAKFDLAAIFFRNV